MILLSIVIPTYNRGGYLDSTLSVLVPQFLRFKNIIEIVISDNASIDNTDEIVNKYRKDIPLKYNKNSTNIGFAKNFQYLIDSSKGQYVYLMGDDDIVAPNFIETVIDLLQSNNGCSLVHWNRLSGDSCCKQNSIVDKDYEESIWKVDARTFISTIREKANFISSLLFHRECWELGGPNVKNEYAGYEWLARLYWGALYRNEPCLYYYFPLVIQRNPSKAWIQYWPQYLASSMSNIFYDLDIEVPGLYDKWKSTLRIEVPKSLHAIGKYRYYYKSNEIKKAIFRHLTTKEKLLYCYYLIPGTYYLWLVLAKLKQLLKW